MERGIHLQIKSDTPVAISLSGGGAKGAYAAGIVQYLLEDYRLSNIRLVYGTSTGGLITAALGAALATANHRFLKKMVSAYRNVTNKDILAPNHCLIHRLAGDAGTFAANMVLGGESIYNIQPLRKLVDSIIDDKTWEAIIYAGKRVDKPLEIGFCVVSLQSGQSSIVTNRNVSGIGPLKEALFASVSQPVFMPLVNIEGTPDGEQYVDGGLIDFNPVEKIFESEIMQHVEAILALSLHDKPNASRSYIRYNNVLDILLRSLEVITDNVYEGDIARSTLFNVILKIKEVLPRDQWIKCYKQMPKELRRFIKQNLSDKKYVPIYHIRPENPLPVGSLDFEQPKLSDLVDLGYECAKKSLAV